MMAQGDRLRSLQMRETRHDAVGMFASAGHQRAFQGGKPRLGPLARGTGPQTEIRRDLIVATACGVKASRGRPDEFGQPRFDGHVNVFKVPVFRNSIRFVLGGDGLKPPVDGLRVFGGNDALSRQHGDMGTASADVFAP